MEKVLIEGSEGITFDSGDLILDSNLWKLETNVEMEGKSGIRHIIQYYGESEKGSNFIMIGADCSYPSMLKAIGTLHVLRMDLGSGLAFVLCQDFGGLWKINLDLSKTDVRIVRGIKFSGPPMIAMERGGTSISKKEYLNNPGQKSKRDRTAIMAEIMQLLSQDSRGITSIIYHCNLNYRSATKVLDELIAKKYVEMRKDHELKASYEITSEGMDALKMIRRFYDIT
ncbi:MAG: hypothetical protein M1431_01085 [Candidatus Thermoplasmatota archaeon]|nr:hypothetical protein [Candidatus Thermoplasmatota archaeon]